MNVIPPETSLDFNAMEKAVQAKREQRKAQSQPAPQPTVPIGGGIKKRPVGKKKDFFVRRDAHKPPVKPPASKPVPIPEPNPTPTPEPAAPKKKPKRKCTPAQLAHLARIRQKANAKRAENKRIKEEMKKKDPNYQYKAARKKQLATDKVKLDEEKAQKRARKKQNQIDLFNEMFNERELLRLEKKEKRRKDKEARLRELISSGRVSINNPKPKPKPAPKPVPKPVPKPKKAVTRVKYENGKMVRYTAYE